MKKLIILALIIGLFNSCTIDDGNTRNFYTEFMPVTTVDAPEQFMLGGTYEISVTYVAPNDCYEFNRFVWQIANNVRTVAVLNTVYTDSNCSDISETVQVSFDLNVTSSETYVFQFWQGQDAQGQDQYYVVEIPVVE